MDMEWDEDDKMLHLGTPVPVILSGNLNTAGTIQPNSATGTVPVTEASAAASLVQMQAMGVKETVLCYTATNPTVCGAGPFDSAAGAELVRVRKKVVTLAAADGAAWSPPRCWWTHPEATTR